jgi:hypothetical protein
MSAKHRYPSTTAHCLAQLEPTTARCRSQRPGHAHCWCLLAPATVVVRAVAVAIAPVVTTMAVAAVVASIGWVPVEVVVAIPAVVAVAVSGMVFEGWGGVGWVREWGQWVCECWDTVVEAGGVWAEQGLMTRDSQRCIRASCICQLHPAAAAMAHWKRTAALGLSSVLFPSAGALLQHCSCQCAAHTDKLWCIQLCADKLVPAQHHTVDLKVNY